MASTFPDQARPARLHGALADPKGAIGGPFFDAFLLWGCPLVSALLVWAWIAGAGLLAAPQRDGAIAALAVAVSVLTFAHLIAVAPRAYLNRDVFEANRRRLTIVPILLIAALTLSPTLLLVGGVVAVFWDVHHSAMQSFGLARIYDMKAGNGPLVLRRADLRLNWALYVGPIAAGASLMAHLETLNSFGPIGWSALAAIPSLAEPPDRHRGARHPCLAGHSQLGRARLSRRDRAGLQAARSQGRADRLDRAGLGRRLGPGHPGRRFRDHQPLPRRAIFRLGLAEGGQKHGLPRPRRRWRGST